MKTRIGLVAITATAAVIGGGFGLGLTAVEASAPASPFADLTSPSPGGMATSVPSSIVSSFAITGTAATPQDALPAAAVESLDATGSPAAHYGVNPTLARLAGVVNGADVWLVPGSTGTCMWVGGSAAVCGPNDLVSTQGIALLQVPVSGARAFVSGVLPDGASVSASNSDASAASVSTSGNAYYVAGQAATTQLEVDTANGEVVEEGDFPSQPSLPGS